LFSSQIPERKNQERRFYDLGSIAYLRSKTVQPMGGSSGNLSIIGLIPFLSPVNNCFEVLKRRLVS